MNLIRRFAARLAAGVCAIHGLYSGNNGCPNCR